MPCFSRRIADLRFQAHNDAAALPVPTTSGDGGAIPATWFRDNWAPRGFEVATCEIIAAAPGAFTVTNPYLWGFDGTTWWLLGKLNGDNDIDVPAGGGGFAVIVSNVAIWERVAVSGTPSVAVDVFFTPVDPNSVVSPGGIP